VPIKVYITGTVLCKLGKNITNLLKVLARFVPKIVYITGTSKSGSMSRPKHIWILLMSRLKQMR